jgi:hypothetical protein
VEGRTDHRIKAATASHAAIALSLIPPILLFSSPPYRTSDEQTTLLCHTSHEQATFAAMNIFIRYLLLLRPPEILENLFILLLGSVVMALVSRLVHGPYKAWYEKIKARANQTPPTVASQSEVDLEAQPLNFPPMPDMFDIEYNPWNLP